MPKKDLSTHCEQVASNGQNNNQKLDIDPSGKLVSVDILPEREYAKDYHFKNEVLNQLFFLRFLKSGIEPTLDNLLDYLSSKNIRTAEITNNTGEKFLEIRGLSLSPLRDYNIENENEFFNVNRELSRLQRDVFSYNGIIQIAGPIGAGKSSIADSMEVRAPAKIYNEMRPNRNIMDWLEDDLYLYLLYSDPKAFFALFNISKPDIFRELFEQGTKELKQGTYRGVIIYDRTMPENFRFLKMAGDMKFVDADDIAICRFVNKYCISQVNTADTTVLRLLKTPESCQNLIHHSRSRDQETKREIIVSDRMNSALYLAKAAMLNSCDKYTPIMQASNINGELDLRKRYESDIGAPSRYKKIMPISVDLAYSKNLEDSYAGFIGDFIETGFKGVIINLDVDDWTRINNDAQQMKLSDVVTMAQCIYHMKGGCKLEYDPKRHNLKLPFPSTSKTIDLTTT